MVLTVRAVAMAAGGLDGLALQALELEVLEM